MNHPGVAANHAPVAHGGIDLHELRALGIDPGDVLDFSASVSPLGTPPEVRAAIAAIDPSIYPDRDCLALREALAERHGVDREQVLIGNGSTELIHLVARAFLKPEERAFTFSPTFGEYAAAAEAQGAQVLHAWAPEKAGFTWDIQTAVDDIRRTTPAIIFLCNPNNPTGVMLGHNDVVAIARAARPGLLLIDEAYASLAESSWDTAPLLAEENIVLLHSMTKDFGLAGARLGYMLASPGIISRARRWQYSWSVSAIAQAAGIAALLCPGHVEASRKVVAEGKQLLRQELPKLGLYPLPSEANFLLIKVGNVVAVRLELLKRGLLVRDCASFGLPEHIRISARRPGECERLVATLKEVLALG